MTPLIEYIFLDSKSLYSYYKHKEVKIDDIIRHLCVIKHTENYYVPDHQINGAKSFISSKYLSLSDLLWKFPLDVSKECLQSFNGLLYIKPNMAEEWFDLISRISPTIFIASWFLAEYEENSLKSATFRQFVKKRLMNQFRYTSLLSPYLPELESFINEQSGLYDLHVHLNGSTETESVWISAVNNPDKAMKEFTDSAKKKSTTKKQLEQIMPEIDIEMFKSCLERSLKYRQEIINYIYEVNYGKKLLEDKSEHLIDELEYLWGDFPENCIYSDIVKEIIFNILVMSSLKYRKNEIIAQKYHFYLITKGLFNALLVQQKSQFGFDQFQSITDNGLREFVEDDYRKRFLQMAGYPVHNYVRFMEGRFSPKNSKSKNRLFVNKIVNDFTTFKNKTNSETELTLIAHFIKQPEEKNKFDDIRHGDLRLSLKRKAEALLSYKQSGDKNAKYLIGVDAAANELDASPDVFAPIFKFLRKSELFRFTYHVGEDFRHLISGIRAIDEAVEFLDMQIGDRLGHCTALGIEPSIWSKHYIGKTYIPRGEWLFNLVWIWNIINTNKECANIQYLIPKIEAYIMRYSQDIFGTTFSPFQLLKSWEFRKYDPYVYLKENRNDYYSSDIIEDYEEWEKITNMLNSNNFLDCINSIVRYKNIRYTLFKLPDKQLCQ